VIPRPAGPVSLAHCRTAIVRKDSKSVIHQTKSTEQFPSGEPDSRSDTQEIPSPFTTPEGSLPFYSLAQETLKMDYYAYFHSIVNYG
jgi:hypothetical protein